jgi:hypothetical protein
MADELSNYKLQLQQVEVALLTDPENAELLKLKEDIGKKKKILKNVNIQDLKFYLIFSRTINYIATRANQNSGG